MVADQWLGAELAGYRIDALVGRGGVGVVYRATHLRLQRPAAVKLLSGGLASDDEYRRRFEREARLAATLVHPHLVPIYDAGFAEGVHTSRCATSTGRTWARCWTNTAR